MANCLTCGAAINLSLKLKQFHSEFGFDPLPYCFLCQQKHRMSFRNSRTLYPRKCDLTGESVISIYAPEKPYKVYKHEEWYGDRWDGVEYGQEFDFSRPFFPQFKALQLKVPRCALLNVNPENSEYCNMCIDNKNCYLVFGGDYNEDAMYCSMNMRNRDVLDIDYSNTNESCYWLFNSHDCYGTSFAFDCSHCTDSHFVSNCSACTECILCTNLRSKTFCIRNEQLSKDTYLAEKTKLLSGSYKQQQALLKEHMDQRSKRIVRDRFAINCEDCTGDYLTNSKGCENCFFTWNSQDLCDLVLADTVTDTFNSSYIGGGGSERCYNVISAIGGKESSCSYFVIDTYRSEYSETVDHCKYVFGCVGLRHKEYCIFNKQYSKEEYEALRGKIIDHMKNTAEWGQFFPKDLSCFAYNESTANEYFPLTKEQAVKEGFSWRNEEHQHMDVQKTITGTQLPDGIDDIPDDILNWAILCEETEKPFRILKQELKFYRTHRIPVPRLHPDRRFRMRMGMMNPFILNRRTCMKCGKAIETTYAPERPEIVYCESCYLQEVY